MEKKNIAELLKNCPKGMELDCTCADNVVFDKIIEYEQIKCVIGECREPLILDKYGRLLHICCPKCVIFPKGKTTWEGFNRPFKDGDIIYVCDEYSDATFTYVAILKQIEKGGKIICHCFYNYEEDYFSTNDFLYDANNTRFATEEEKEELFKVIKDNGYKWNPETMNLEKLPMFKDGDILANDDTVFIYNGIEELSPFPSYYVYAIAEKNGHFAMNTTTKKYGTRFATEEEKNILFEAIKNHGYKWYPDTKTLTKLPMFKDGDVITCNNSAENWTIQDAKDGDIVSYGDGWTCIFKRIHGIWYSSYCFITNDGEFHTGYEDHEVSTTINGNVHIANEEEKKKLFKAIKDNGYRWNPETKILEKLPKFKVGDKIKLKGGDDFGFITQVADCFYTIKNKNHTHYWPIKKQDDWELVPNKFDILKLKPFDKVLVRDFDNETWEINFFSRLREGKYFKCLDLSYMQCIPFEGNEHLYDTTNKCDEFYRTWESYLS